VICFECSRQGYAQVSLTNTFIYDVRITGLYRATSHDPSLPLSSTPFKEVWVVAFRNLGPDLIGQFQGELFVI